MTTHIADCGYSTLFTAGLLNVLPTQQASLLDQFRQTSTSPPRILLAPSDPSPLDGSPPPPPLHIQVPSGAAEPGDRARLRIVTSSSPIAAITSSLLSAGLAWRLNERRRDVTGRSPARRSPLQTLVAGRERNGPCYSLKRSIGASPKPPPTTPLPPPPLPPPSDDIKLLIPYHAPLIIVTNQNQARLITSNGKHTLTPAINEDLPSSPFQGEGEALPDSPIQVSGTPWGRV